MATQPRFEPEPCANGRHRPKRVPIGSAGGDLRTTCRDCGCQLVRTLATRQWFYSGPLT
jgi:hypothetical protein